jgi:pimeloyl-ACP methyl ester carboxylesterase
MARFASSGGELAYDLLGEGEPLLLLHGFPLEASQWRDLAPLFASRFRVIVPDLLGSGASEASEGASLGIEAQAGYARELLDHLGVERVAVVGHSCGGGVAQFLTLQDPRVEALVLLDAIAFDAWPAAPIEAIRRVPPQDQNLELVEASIRSWLLDGTARHDRLSEDVIEGYLRSWRRPGGVAAFFRTARALDGRGLTGREDEMAAWDMPVLLLWGEDDPYLPVEVAERLQEAIPSSSLGILPGCGHSLVEDAADTIGPMILEYLRARFLRQPHGHAAEPGGVVMLQLERRPPWVDLEEYEREDEEPTVPDPAGQEVGSAYAARDEEPDQEEDE